MEAQTAIKANVKEAVPFFGVRNMDRSLKFYLEQLGFVMRQWWIPEERIRWCHVQRGGANLMLQEYLPDFVPKDKFGEGVSVCFICEDALALFHEIKSRGVQLNEPFVGNNMWVVECSDPDGYRLCFESFTDVPEGTTYTEWNTKS